MIFSLFMHTFSRYCNYNVFRHVDRFLFGARDAGVFEFWFTRYLKKVIVLQQNGFSFYDQN